MYGENMLNTYLFSAFMNSLSFKPQNKPAVYHYLPSPNW